MMQKKKEIWKQVKKNIESRLQKSEFNTWFSRTTLLQVDSHVVTIGVPNKFVACWIKEKYIDEIKTALIKVLKKTTDFHITFNPTGVDNKETGSTPSRGMNSVHEGHHLDPTLCFERFVKGEGNRFALSSALEVAKKPATQYNPLYIYGKSGFGKTHLLNGIGNYALKKNHTLKVRYLTADDFTAEITSSIKRMSSQEVKKKYSHYHLLLLDDVQKLETRKRVQGEFIAVFDALHEANGQIVVTSDRAPNELTHIHSQLKSRLGWGLLSEIHPPDQETRINIIKQKIKEDRISLPEDVIFFLANANRDIKTLIKNLIRVETYASLHSRGLNISMVKSIVRERDRTGIGVEDIKTITAGYFNITLKDLISNKKKRIYAYPRQIAIYLSRKHTPLSLNEIGAAFGPKDHSTVVYSIRRIEKTMAQEKEVRKDIKNIEKLLN